MGNLKVASMPKTAHSLAGGAERSIGAAGVAASPRGKEMAMPKTAHFLAGGAERSIRGTPARTGHGGIAAREGGINA
jgi:hypothetical protein